MKIITVNLLFSILLVCLNLQINAQSRHYSAKAIIDTKANWDGQDIIPPLLLKVDQTDFISKQLDASAVIKSNKVDTKMEVSAVVEADGSMSSFKVKGTGPAVVGTEFIRIIKRMPKYKPGTKNGKPARFRCYYPFELKYTKDTKIS